MSLSRPVWKTLLATGLFVLVSWIAVLAVVLHRQAPHGPMPELVQDDAGLLDAAGRSRVIEYHDALRDGYDIDYRVVTISGAPDLNRFAAESFADDRVGNLSGSGKGLLLVIDPAKERVRLEVGRKLEGVYTDAFVKYIEERQMVPFFRRNRVVDGIIATTEMIVTRAQETAEVLAGGGRAEPSTGAGAVTGARIGQFPERKKGTKPDVPARGNSPEQTVHAYVRAMAEGNDRPDLGIYTRAAREMFRNWVVTEAQMRNLVRDHRKCTEERTVIQEDKAVVRYSARQKFCAPYLLRREDGAWRIDFATMQKAIRFDQHNHWHMWVPNELSFAFPELQPTVVDNSCRWCFTFRNEDMVIVSIDDDSPAEAMGLREGDRIVAVDGRKNPGMRWVSDRLSSVEPGQPVAFTVLRDGTRLTLTHPAPPK